MIRSGNRERIHFLVLQNRPEIRNCFGGIPEFMSRSTVTCPVSGSISTSQMWETRAESWFAFKDARCAYPRPFSPMIAKLSRSLAPKIRE